MMTLVIPRSLRHELLLGTTNRSMMDAWMEIKSKNLLYPNGSRLIKFLFFLILILIGVGGAISAFLLAKSDHTSTTGMGIYTVLCAVGFALCCWSFWRLVKLKVEILDYYHAVVNTFKNRQDHLKDCDAWKLCIESKDRKPAIKAGFNPVVHLDWANDINSSFAALIKSMENRNSPLHNSELHDHLKALLMSEIAIQSNFLKVEKWKSYFPNEVKQECEKPSV